MHKTTDEYVEKFNRRRLRDKQNYIALQAVLSLAIDQTQYPDEVVYALGYPELDGEFEAVQAWVQDNYIVINYLENHEAVEITCRALSHRLDEHFGEEVWHCPHQFKIAPPQVIARRMIKLSNKGR